LLKDACLDHQHKPKKSSPNIENGNGLIRGVLCRGCNIIEGKCWNNCTRFGFEHEELPRLLRNMADYIEERSFGNNLPYIHPSEKPREPNLSKRQFNLLNKKLLKAGKKKLEFPKKKKLTKLLKRKFEEYSIHPYLNKKPKPTSCQVSLQLQINSQTKK
jgi:hypothetical protein